MAAIKIDNLYKHFGKTKAVDGISFEVEKGEVFGFLGPNGAGKSTTIRCLMDFIRPTKGKIEILGKDAQKDSVELNRHIGYLSGQVHLYEKWTGQMHINMLKKLNGDQDISAELCERLDFNSNFKAKKLSSGNRQKLGIILSLMCKPEILILDEPTNALDPLMQQTVYKLIKEASENGTTIFMSSHNLAEVERVCDRVSIIKKGKMITTESIDSLKDKRVYSVRITFKNKPTEEIFKEIETEGLESIQHGFKFTIKGDINPTLSILNNQEIDDLEVNRASLEDIFLEYY